MNDELLRMRDAAEVLAVSERTVRRWIRSGRLRAVFLDPDDDRSIRIRRKELDKFIASLRESSEVTSEVTGELNRPTIATRRSGLVDVSKCRNPLSP
jgi:excisionase family DNA binding protein